MFDFLLANDLLSALLAFAIVLIPSVIVHELGHFLAARAVGITVLEFGIGFPPRAARLFMWRETEFTLNWLPLGGFVRPFGEDMVQTTDETQDGVVQQTATASGTVNTEPDDDTRRDDPLYTDRQVLAERGVHNPTSVYDVKPIPRIFFMAAGALANFLFAVVVFILIGMIGLPTEVGTRLGLAVVDDESPVATAGLQQLDWITQVNGDWIESNQQFIQVLEDNLGQTVTLSLRRVQDDGETFGSTTLDVDVTEDFLAAWQATDSYVRVTSISEESPAQLAGLEPDDLIFAFNGESIQDTFNPSQTLIDRTNVAAGSEITLTVLRDGEPIQINLVPREDPPPGQGRIGIGISSEYTRPDQTLTFVQGAQIDYVPSPIGESIQYGVDTISEIFRRIAELPSRMASGNTQPGETRVISIVGVSQWGGEILQDSISENNITTLLRYIALISIALGFTNLLPIPALDGGRIVFALIELIRGKPIPPEREGYVHMIGLIFLLSLGILLIINDLANPVTDLLP
jgi:regulator of sigma E protease